MGIYGGLRLDKMEIQAWLLHAADQADKLCSLTLIANDYAERLTSDVNRIMQEVCNADRDTN